MWKRSAAVSSSGPRLEVVSIDRREPPQPTPMARPAVDVGASVVLRGEVSGSEDLTVDGVIEGRIDLTDGELTIGAHARITAPIVARRVQIGGRVVGDVQASEAVIIGSTGSLHGDITAPRVEIADGAYFRGRIDMSGAVSASRLGPRLVAV